MFWSSVLVVVLVIMLVRCSGQDTGRVSWFLGMLIIPTKRSRKQQDIQEIQEPQDVSTKRSRKQQEYSG